MCALCKRCQSIWKTLPDWEFGSWISITHAEVVWLSESLFLSCFQTSLLLGWWTVWIARIATLLKRFSKNTPFFGWSKSLFDFLNKLIQLLVGREGKRRKSQTRWTQSDKPAWPFIVSIFSGELFCLAKKADDGLTKKTCCSNFVELFLPSHRTAYGVHINQ